MRDRERDRRPRPATASGPPEAPGESFAVEAVQSGGVPLVQLTVPNRPGERPLPLGLSATVAAWLGLRLLAAAARIEGRAGPAAIPEGGKALPEATFAEWGAMAEGIVIGAEMLPAELAAITVARVMLGSAAAENLAAGPLEDAPRALLESGAGMLRDDCLRAHRHADPAATWEDGFNVGQQMGVAIGQARRGRHGAGRPS